MVPYGPIRAPRAGIVRPGASEAYDASDEQGQSLGWQTFGALEAREEKDEALRLFYVAATRARDALILEEREKEAAAAKAAAEKAEQPAQLPAAE